MAAATAEAAAAAAAAELRALQESCLRGSFIRPGRAAIVRRRARAVGKAGSQCSHTEMPSSFKFEIGALMLPVCDRMSQEGHFSISGHAAVSCYDCIRFVSGLFESSSHLMEYIDFETIGV